MSPRLPSESQTHRPKPAWRRVVSSPWLSPLNELDGFDELLAPLGSTFAFQRVLARVKSVRQEALDTRTLTLIPNWRWSGFVAGQSVPVEVEIDGRLHRRHYSLTSDPEQRGSLSITVKRQPGGRVSNALHEQVQPGDVLRLYPAEGEFVLPHPVPPRLLMIGAGSGVTPFRSMLLALRREGYSGDIRFLHISRDSEQAIFREEWQRWSREWPGFGVQWIHTASQGRPLWPDTLEQRVPDYRERLTLACGPAPLLNTLQRHWDHLGLSRHLRMERFGVAAVALPDQAEAEVSALHSGRSFIARPGQPLLGEAERAGLAPAYGCRKGICHSCRYVKASGITENLLTGEVSAEPDVAIQLCICIARSDLVLQDL